MQAYRYSFFNRMSQPIAVAIQFAGEKEPLYKKLIKPGAKETFEEGKFEIPLIKSGYCLKSVYYVLDPTTAQKKNKFESAPWKEKSISWLPMNVYKTTIDNITKSKIKSKAKKNTSPEENTDSPENLIKKNKQKITHLFCKDLHFDIIAKENDKPCFVTPIEE